MLVYFSALTSLSCTASAIQLPSLSLFRQIPIEKPYSDPQSPMSGPGIQLPADTNDGKESTGGSDVTISDVLPKQRKVNIFAQLTRDVSSVTSRLESSDNTTLLAPLNSAMQALPRKPWEDRPDDTIGVSALHDTDKAAENLRRFVEEHVVPVSPWREGEKGKTKTLGGAEVWWERRGEDGKKFIMPSAVEVDDVVERVGNGELWTLNGVCNYAS